MSTSTNKFNVFSHATRKLTNECRKREGNCMFFTCSKLPARKATYFPRGGCITYFRQSHNVIPVKKTLGRDVRNRNHLENSSSSSTTTESTEVEGSVAEHVVEAVEEESSSEPIREQESLQRSGSNNFLDAPIVLPGGLTSSRRNLLRLVSFAVGLGTTSYAINNMKVLNYASPQAIWNAVLGGVEPPFNSTQGDNSGQRAALKQFLVDLDARGGGSAVPEFQPGLEWLNAPPLRLSKELRGKIVVLDFWTYCCINCMHVLPDLAYLEDKYKGEPVAVVGVHSAKFDNEKDSEAIRNAVLRYDVTHPVVNDGEMSMWRALGVSSWPTLALVGPTGRLIGMLSGEGHRQDLDDLLAVALEHYGEQPGALDRSSAVPQLLEKDKDRRLLATPLRFPGKVATDLANGRLFISDSNNHRIVVTDLEGQFLAAVGGAGGPGFRDGSFQGAGFNRPQGVAYNAAANVLYVADTENHALRAVDFVAESVVTLAGTGEKGSDYRGGSKGTQQALNSPWDVVVGPGVVYIAMAGQHQVWIHDLATTVTQRFSGTGYERNQNGDSGSNTAFAQPSGLSLAPGGRQLYVADSESSSVREVDTATGGARGLAGGDPYFAENLFKFGDVDGVGSGAQLQHPLGVLAATSDDGTLAVLVADSYNHKIKLLDPRTQSVTTLVGSGQAGFRDGSGTDAQLSEPAGLAQGPNGCVFVADTNNSVIRVLDVAKRQLSTLDLSSVPPPPVEAPVEPEVAGGGPRRLRKRKGTQLAGAEVVRVQEKVTAGSGTLAISIDIPQGYHFTKGATSRFEVEIDPDDCVVVEPLSGSLDPKGFGEASTQVAANLKFYRSNMELASSGGLVRINCKVYYCQQDEVCLYKALTFEVPIAEGEATEGLMDQIVNIKYNIIARALDTKKLIG